MGIRDPEKMYSDSFGNKIKTLLENKVKKGRLEEVNAI